MTAKTLLKAKRTMPRELVTALNGLVVDELHAVTTYMHQSSMCSGWGYHKLAEHFKEEALEEFGHAMKLMDRLNLFDIPPTVKNIPDVEVKTSPLSMLEHQLDLEEGAVANYNKAVALARLHEDNATKDLLTQNLNDEEVHYDWLTEQLQRIDDMGIKNYLQEFALPNPVAD